MAKTHWTILFITFGVSCVSFALYVVSISTTNWIEATARYTDQGFNSDEVVNYGLFSGSAIRQVLAIRNKFDLTVVCDYSKGACAYSCQDNSDSRKAELNNILSNEQLNPCPSQPRSLTRSTTDFIARDVDTVDVSNQYMPAGYWVCTVLFLSIAIGFTAASGLFSLINMVYSPVEPIFNIFGLYIWNSIAAASSLLALILWAVLFDKHLNDNIAVTDTLNSKDTFISKGNASIGFSFYIMVVAFFLNLANIGLLLLRIYLVNRNAEAPTITIDKNDSPLEFY